MWQGASFPLPGVAKSETISVEVKAGFGFFCRLVKRGEVKIMRTELEHEKELALMHAGDFFGEVTLFDYALRTAAALTVQDTVLLEISRNNFNRLFKNNPRIVAKLLYQMMTEMSRRLRRRNNPGGGLIL